MRDGFAALYFAGRNQGVCPREILSPRNPWRIPIDLPEKWDVQLERGSNAVAAKLLTLLESGEKSAAEIAEALEIKSRSFLTNRYLVPLMAKGLIRQTLPDKPKSRFQRCALA